VASAGRLAAGSPAGAFMRAAARGARGALKCRETFAESSELKSAASLAPLAAAGCSGAKLPMNLTALFFAPACLTVLR
jgi:hypothetical protein